MAVTFQLLENYYFSMKLLFRQSSETFSSLLLLKEDHKISEIVSKMVNKIGHCRQVNMILNF